MKKLFTLTLMVCALVLLSPCIEAMAQENGIPQGDAPAGSSEHFHGATARRVASAKEKSLLIDALTQDAHFWGRDTVLDTKSLHNFYAFSTPWDGGLQVRIHADFTVNRGASKGWVNAGINSGKVGCLEYFDTHGECPRARVDETHSQSNTGNAAVGVSKGGPIGKCAVMEFESVQKNVGYGQTRWASVRVLKNNCDYAVEFDVGGQFGGRFVRVEPGYLYQPGDAENWSGVVRKAKN